ncbi:ammonium transporter [Lyngbya aestuarii]|uniref:ammonium transporter n=1 Tax=Lyngbya aestuarii TaxID=118322 RepID=UPI00403DABD1
MSRQKFKQLNIPKTWLFPQKCFGLLFFVGVFLVGLQSAIAQDSLTLEQRLEQLEQNSQTIRVILDTIWVVFASTLVFFMNAGFAMLETGLCRQKNTVNMLSKNVIVFAISTVAFWGVGFGIMFGDGNSFFGTHGFFLSGVDNSPATGDTYRGVFSAISWAGIPLQAKFLFQLVFAGTAATIVSGAVAERIKFGAFLLFSLFLVSLSYPVTGHWVWGNGWLSGINFRDFAGSTVVHSVGGCAGLVGTLLLRPRLGKYQDDGNLEKKSFSYSYDNRSSFGRKITAIPAHNLGMATLGGLILWLGWFGFNSGSTLAANPQAITHILLTTNLAAAMGAIGATFTSWLYFGKPDLTFMINGVLAGLVSITASCAFVYLPYAVLIGMFAGIIVVFSSIFLEKREIDDPVGAISVHLACGIWGTLAVGLFSVGPDVFPWYTENLGPASGLLLGGGFQQLFAQLLGIISVGTFTAILSLFAWSAIDLIIGLRVSPEDEIEGLDLSEHGMSAYDITPEEEY